MTEIYRCQIKVFEWNELDLYHGSDSSTSRQISKRDDNLLIIDVGMFSVLWLPFHINVEILQNINKSEIKSP